MVDQNKLEEIFNQNSIGAINIANHLVDVIDEVTFNRMAQIKHKIGDLVVALDSSIRQEQQERKVGKLYEVLGVDYCLECDTQRINIATNNLNMGDWLKCDICETTQSTLSKQWTNSFLFAPLEDLQIYIDKAVSEDKFELAIILRQTQLDNIKIEELY